MRISRSVLREAGGETPPAYSPVICWEPMQRHTLGELPGPKSGFQHWLPLPIRDVPSIGCRLLSDYRITP